MTVSVTYIIINSWDRVRLKIHMNYDYNQVQLLNLTLVR